MKFRINVTKEILRESMYCGLDKSECIPQNCAIARAIRVLFPDVRVGSRKISFYNPALYRNIRFYYPIFEVVLPAEAIRFIHQFDSFAKGEAFALRLDMKPISFDIELTDEQLEQVLNVDISEIINILKDCKSLELIEA